MPYFVIFAARTHILAATALDREGTVHLTLPTGSHTGTLGSPEPAP